MPYLEKEILAQIAVGAVAFLLVLIIVSVISVKISDYVVDSSAGSFDRTLGFIFGVVRGFVFVAIAYLFYGWLLPFDKQETWVRNAYSLPMIKSAGEGLLSFMPPEIAETLSNTALQKQQDTATPDSPEPNRQRAATRRMRARGWTTSSREQAGKSSNRQPDKAPANEHRPRLRTERGPPA